GLTEVRLLVEVTDLEQRGSPFTRRGSQNRRIAQDEAVAVEEVAGSADDLVADPHDRPRSPGSQPQVPPIQQELDAMLLRCDRERLVLRNAMDDLQVGDAHLVAAGRAR